MLQSNGIMPIIIPSNADETLPMELSMEQSVMYLALKKALNVEKLFLADQADTPENYVVIAADTIVYKNGAIGKPSDRHDAENTLKLLRGTSHYVATGVAFIWPGKPKRSVFCDVTEVFFNDYSDDEIQSYINTEEPWDKAGSYAIQGAWGKHVHHIEGDYDNVIGFPWGRIKSELINNWPEISQEIFPK